MKYHKLSLIVPKLTNRSLGIHPQHPYVWKFWVPVVGKHAIIDLKRLIRAAVREEALKYPYTASTLLRYRLIRMTPIGLEVPALLPAVPPHLVKTLPYNLRLRHDRLDWSAIAVKQ